MPPPVAYLTIDAYPYSRVITQAEFNGGTFGNTTNEVWFRIDVDEPTVVGFYIEIGGTFSPRWDLFEDDGSTLLRSVNSSTNPSWYYPVQAGTYYLQVRRRLGGASDFDFTFHGDSRPWDNFDIPNGAIVINDDTGTLLPAAVVDATSGEVIGYVSFPASEHGVALASGVTAWYDRFGRYGAAGTVAIFNANNDYVVSTSQVFNDPPSMSASESQIFILDSGTGNIYSINQSSGAAGVVATVGSVTATSIGVNAEGTIVYYVDADDYINAFNPSDNVVHAWDLDANVALPDLYTEPDIATDVGGFSVTPNFWPGEILVLPDGAVVLWARNEDAAHDTLLHIDSDGTLLHSYVYNHASRQINHLAYNGSSTSSVLVWFYAPTDADGIVTTVALADGSESNTISFEMFSAGVNNNGNTSTIFGISNSCTFAVLGARTVPRDYSPQCPCPCECPTPPSGVSPGHVGTTLPPIEPSWDPNCAGGGVVPTAADATDPESWAA